MDTDSEEPPSGGSDAPEAEVAASAERSTQLGVQRRPKWETANVEQALIVVLVIATVADVLSKAVDAWYMAVREAAPLTLALWYEKWTSGVSPLMSAYISGTIPIVAVLLTYWINPPRVIARAVAKPLRREPGKWAERLGWFAWACFVSFSAWHLKGAQPSLLMLLSDVTGGYVGARLGVPLLLALSGWYLRVRPGSNWVSQWRPSLQQTAAQGALIGANVFGLAAARVTARLFEKVGIRGEQALEEALRPTLEWLAKVIATALHSNL